MNASFLRSAYGGFSSQSFEEEPEEVEVEVEVEEEEEEDEYRCVDLC